jgi:hypothetical protein
MLLRLIKTNRNAGFLMFPLIVAGVCIYLIKFQHPYQGGTDENVYILFGFLNHLLNGNLILKTILASGIVFIAGLFLFRINREFLFLNSWSALPVILFIIMTIGLPEYGRFHSVWFSFLFFLPGVARLLMSFDLRKPYRNVFEAGFFLSLGSLFYFNLLFLLPAFIIGGRMMVRDPHWREPFLVFLGAFVPWLLVFSTYFLIDKTQVLIQWMHNSFLHSSGESILKNIPLLSYLCLLVFLTFLGSIAIIRQYGEKKVRFRKFFMFFFLLFVSAVISFVLIPGSSSEILIFAAMPVSFLLSNYFDSMKKLLFGEIVLGLIIVFVVLMRFLG